MILTSLTTFLGLFPMVLETSVQARFLIPMAISLALGVVAATGVILIVVPCSLIVLDNNVQFFRWILGKKRITPRGKPPRPPQGVCQTRQHEKSASGYIGSDRLEFLHVGRHHLAGVVTFGPDALRKSPVATNPWLGLFGSV